MINVGKHSSDIQELSAIEVYKLVLEGDIKRFPMGFWQGPEAKASAVEVIKYLAENVLKLVDIKDIKKKLTFQVFRDNGLGGMLNQLYGNSSCIAVKTAYSDKEKSKIV